MWRVETEFVGLKVETERTFLVKIYDAIENDGNVSA